MSAPELAARLRSLKPSATVAIAQRAAELRQRGHDVLSFSLGEPDFRTPPHIVEAVDAALARGETQYTAVRGVPALLDAIRADSERRRGVSHERSEIVASVGAKHTLYNLSLALYEPGDEVIVPAPYWVSYPAQIELAGARTVVVETREADGFKLRPEALAGAITARTKALILCTPSNPTGSAYTADELRALAGVLAAHRMWIIVDEIYGRLVYDDFEHVSLARVAPELRDRLIVVDGVSKTYAMTGFRIGWMLGPAAVAKACDALQGQSTTNPASIAQHAAVAALNGPDEPVEAMRRAFEERRNEIVGALNAIPGLSCRKPEGAFYAFFSVEGLYGRKAGDTVLADDVGVAEWLLDAAGCALVPGAEFGAPGYLRLSYAASLETLRDGAARIARAVDMLR